MTEPVKKSKDELEMEKKEKEEMEKQNRLTKEIKETEEQLKFTLEERKKVLSQKKKEIEKKDKIINQMEETNLNLTKEIENLKVEMESKLSKIELTLNETKFWEKERKERLSSYQQVYDSKEEEIKASEELIKNYKKEINKLRKNIDKNVDIDKLNELTDKIKKTINKNNEIENEIKYLEEIQKEHFKCEIEQNKLNKDIEEKEKFIVELKKENKENAKIISDEGSNVIKKKLENKIPKGEILEKMNKNRQIIYYDVQEKLDECKDLNEEQIDEIYNSNDNDLYISKKHKIKKPPYEIEKINQEKTRKKILGIQRNLSERIRIGKEKDMDIILPKINLFNSQEKKILSNVLPKTEIEKYEK